MRLLLAFCFCLFVLGSSYSQELVPFLKGDKYGYSDLDQRLVVEALYDDAFFMNNGIGIVKKGQSWGAVDSIGNVIADFKTGTYRFSDCFIAATKTFSILYSLITLRSEFLVTIGIILPMPISVAFSKNHS